MTSVGIVIPTLGQRLDLLENSIASIRKAGKCHICVVAPIALKAELEIRKIQIEQFIEDPKNGLVGAINIGFASLPESVEFCNWLGDDDELIKDSLLIAGGLLDLNPQAPFVYGACGYIDEAGNQLWVNQSGRWAVKLLRFGPDLIPQPGALIRRSYLEKMLPIKGKYKLAFDFDMFIELAKLGKPIYTKQKLANFRWHSDSLTVANRKASALEASKVRKSHLPKALRFISELWELPVRVATNVGGARLLKSKAK